MRCARGLRHAFTPAGRRKLRALRPRRAPARVRYAWECARNRQSLGADDDCAHCHSALPFPRSDGRAHALPNLHDGEEAGEEPLGQGEEADGLHGARARCRPRRRATLTRAAGAQQGLRQVAHHGGLGHALQDHAERRQGARAARAARGTSPRFPPFCLLRPRATRAQTAMTKREIIACKDSRLETGRIVD